MEELEFEAAVAELIEILQGAFNEKPQVSHHSIPMGLEYQITLERLRVFALLDRNDFRIDLTFQCDLNRTVEPRRALGGERRSNPGRMLAQSIRVFRRV
jgi:hypothetical protein